MQDPPDPDSEQPEHTPFFPDTKVPGVLANEDDSPSVAEVHKRVKKNNLKRVQWGKIAKAGAVAIGIPSIFGFLGLFIFNFFYPQKVHDFFARRKKPPSTFISPRHLPRPEGKINSLFSQAERLIAEGNSTKAQALFTELLQSSKLDSHQTAQAWNRLGKLYAVEGRIEEADSAYHESIKADPGQYKSYVDRAKLLSDRGDWAAALSSVNKALERYPDDVTAKALKQELISRLALETRPGLEPSN